MTEEQEKQARKEEFSAYMEVRAEEIKLFREHSKLPFKIINPYMRKMFKEYAETIEVMKSIL